MAPPRPPQHGPQVLPPPHSVEGDGGPGWRAEQRGGSPSVHAESNSDQLRPEQVADGGRPSKQKRRRRNIGESEEKPRCERRAPRSATGRRPGTAGAASHSLTAEKFPKIIVSFKINRRYPGRLPDLRCGLRRPRPRLCRRRRWRCARAAALRSPAAPHHRADVGALPSPDPPRPSPSAGTPLPLPDAEARPSPQPLPAACDCRALPTLADSGRRAKVFHTLSMSSCVPQSSRANSWLVLTP
ncbi:WAS/WASL-interacting protein family member 3-like [Schistocerca serialis cubense]|uniref:WAS/WASL-interacting protein family member 3-like n=1 Tax=Schistocerca serialis cubense TaxID=2023355 RepID=UPI00214EC8E6|nr:WAS/WASL-interacting protein family member 3-like [Schistocerca serialis cubense]